MTEGSVVEPSSDMLKTERTCTDVTTVSPHPNDISMQVQSVISVIRRDMIAADLKWSLFIAASQSYKHDSCLRPFPPLFLIDGNKDLSKLREALESVPPFSQLEILAHTLPKAVIELLHWVLVELKEPSLTVVDKAEVSSVLKLVSCELSAPSPSLVVGLSYDPSSTAEIRWSVAKECHGSLHAFHGSKVENFHSILQHGLQQHLTKNALFGQGVYLSSELLVCLPYSRNGLGWTHSSVGSELSVVALCEVLDHPSIHCQAEGNCENKSRARAKDSLAGEVPHKLYVVPNSDLVRVRHLLVYTAQTAPLRSQGMNQSNSWFLTWLSRHKMAISLCGYAVMLASIGLSRSTTILRFWRGVCHTLGLNY